MAEITSEPLKANRWLSVPWREYISREGSTFTGAFGRNVSRRTMVIDVYAEDEEQAVADILGYSFVEAPGRLSRLPPIQHPLYPQLWATAIPQVQGIAWDGKIEIPPVPNQQYPGAAISSYVFSRLTILFETLPFQVMSDSMFRSIYGEAANEYYRYTEYRYAVSGTTLSVPQDSFLFVPGTASPGKAIPVSPAWRITQMDLGWIWHDVPVDAVLDDNGLPTNILTLLGTVNQHDFPVDGAYPAGTLLLLGAKIEPEIAPVSPLRLGFNPSYQPALILKITFAVRHFDPQVDDPSRPRGHNIFPDFTTNGNWYLATYGGNVAGATLYEPQNWNLLFGTL